MRMIMFGLLTMIASTLFSQDPYRPAPATAGKIIRIEYFLDNDPGTGNGINIPVAASENISNKDVQVMLDGITNGIHLLYVRSKDEFGVWSLTSSYLFDNFELPSYPVANSRNPITAAEYFIDSDPGIGNATSLAINADTSMTTQLLVNLNGLTAGVHQLYIRTKDGNDKWSMTNYSLFDNSSIEGYRAAPASPGTIKEVEYYIDTDPGFGLGKKIAVPSSSDIAAFNVDIDISGLSEGEHVVYFRSLETPWSLSAYVPLQVGSVLPVKWLYVRAEVSKKGNIIQWATSSEVNADKFIVEHSLDGKIYKSAGEVLAKNHSTGSSYRFTHPSDKTGLHFYRIKQIDKDGNFTYSKVVQVFMNTKKEQVIVYPNPANKVLFIQSEPGKTINQVSLMDQQGKVLKVLRGNEIRSNPVSLTLSGLVSGAYYVKISYKDAAIIYPIMKN